MKKVLRTVVVCLMSVLCLASVNAYAEQQGLYQNFQRLGTYYSLHFNQYWLVVYPLIDKYRPGGNFDMNNVQVTLEEKSGKKIPIASDDLSIINLGDMYFKKAAQYRLFRFNLVIDNSASICDTDLELLQDTLSKFIRRLPLSFEAQIIRFSSQIKKSGFTNDKNQLISWIKEPHERGMTALYDAIATGVDELKFSNDDIPFKFSIILTDGIENESKKYTDANVFQKKIVKDTTDLNIPLLVVGVTSAVNEPLLKNISQFGFYRHAKGFPEVDKAFDFFEKLIRDIYVIRIPGVSSLSKLNKIYLGEEMPDSNKTTTIQDFSMH